MTIDELIDKLTELRDKHGCDFPVYVGTHDEDGAADESKDVVIAVVPADHFDPEHLLIKAGW